MEAILRPKTRRADLLPLPRPLSSFGGRAIDRLFLFLLETDPESSRIVRIRRSNREAEEVPLACAGAMLDAYGLAHPGDGTFWTLAGRGRELIRFDEETGRLVESRPLPGAFPGIWDLAGRIVLSKAPTRAGDPLLFREEEGGLLPFASLAAHAAGEAASLLLENLVACGPSEGDELPCWRVTDGSEIFVVNGREETRRLALSAPLHSETDVSERIALRDAVDPQPPSFPLISTIKDVFLTAPETSWILRRGSSGSDFLVRHGPEPPATCLPLNARYSAILEVRSGRAHLLREDGSSEWI